MNETNVLRWALHVDAHLPSSAELDEDRLLALLCRYNLGLRLLSRLQRERLTWGSGRLWAHLLATRAEIRAQHERHRQVLHDLSEMIAHDPWFVVPIKGITSHALTGIEDHLHYSDDIDILSRNPEYLSHQLEQQGYTHDLRKPADHEHACLVRDGVLIEIHEWAGVWSYPEGALPATLIPCVQPGKWIESFCCPIEYKVVHQDLVCNVASESIPAMPKLAVPTAAMNILISCAHEFRHAVQEFRNYIYPNFQRVLPVRLDRIADIFDLIRHTSFDRNRFVLLVEKFQAQDCVRFVGYLGEIYFGVNPFALTEFECWKQNQYPFPKLLAVLAMWSHMHTKEDYLLPLHPSFSAEALGMNFLMRSELADANYTCWNQSIADGVQLRIGRATSLEVPHVSLRIEEPQVYLEVHLSGMAASNKYCVTIYSADPPLLLGEAEVFCQDGVWELCSTTSAVVWIGEFKAGSRQILFPCHKIFSSLCLEGVHMFVIVSVWKADDTEHVHASELILLPFSVR